MNCFVSVNGAIRYLLQKNENAQNMNESFFL